MREIIANDFDQHLGDGIVILLFTAPWCTYCKQLKPNLYEIPDWFEDDKITLLECDVDKLPDVAGTYGVMGLPTMGFFKSGKLVKKVSGVKTTHEIRGMVEEIKNG